MFIERHAEGNYKTKHAETARFYYTHTLHSVSRICLESTAPSLALRRRPGRHCSISGIPVFSPAQVWDAAPPRGKEGDHKKRRHGHHFASFMAARNNIFSKLFVLDLMTEADQAPNRPVVPEVAPSLSLVTLAGVSMPKGLGRPVPPRGRVGCLPQRSGPRTRRIG